MKNMLIKHCINKQTQAKMEYLKLGLLTWFANICKPLAVQLIFLRVDEIHLNKSICTAVCWAELCPAGINGTSLLWSQDTECDQSSDSWFLFFMPVPLIFTCTISIWRQTSLSVGWVSIEMFELLKLCVLSLFFSDIQGLWHFGFVLMAYSFLPEMLSLWEQREHVLRQHLWKVRGGPLNCRESWSLSPSDRPFLCGWEILLP